MPWQQHVMDVALEIDPATGGLWYRFVQVGVPRQSGKTSLVLPRAVWRAEAAHLLGGRQRMLYAAQRAIAARKKWEDEFLQDLASSPRMDGRWHPIKATGNERIRFQGQKVPGSTLAPIATLATSGHGETLDDGTLDEAFAQVDAVVEASWRPAMSTRRQAQMWTMSTAGTLKSVYWNGKVRSGRAIVEAEKISRTAVFEWSAPVDADPYDPATWWACMPALGHTIDVDFIREELDSMEGGLPAFRRAYLNQLPGAFDDLPWAIPKESWAACRDPLSVRESRPALAVDMTPDRARASVSFAGARADGLPMVQVVRNGEGSDWLVKDTADIAYRKRATVVVIDKNGPASNKITDLQAALSGLCPVLALDTGQVANACGSIYDATVTEQLRHIGQPELDDAVKDAIEVKKGDRFVWGRRAQQTTDISPLYSAALALAGLAAEPGSTYEDRGFTTL